MTIIMPEYKIEKSEVLETEATKEDTIYRFQIMGNTTIIMMDWLRATQDTDWTEAVQSFYLKEGLLSY